MLQADKISNQKISDIIAERIEDWIRTGKVNPGDKLPSVRELCEMFDVGRSAVRDALTTLKGKGLVEVRRGEGTFVCHLNTAQLLPDVLLIGKDDIHKLYQVRKILEAGIVELAAANATNEHLEKMHQALEDLKTASTLKAWEADYRFHEEIVKASSNDILVELMDMVSTTTKQAIMECHRVILSDPSLAMEIINQHCDIYEAIKSRDGNGAREAMYKHLNYVESLLDSYFSDQRDRKG